MTEAFRLPPIGLVGRTTEQEANLNPIQGALLVQGQGEDTMDMGWGPPRVSIRLTPFPSGDRLGDQGQPPSIPVEQNKAGNFRFVLVQDQPLVGVKYVHHVVAVTLRPLGKGGVQKCFDIGIGNRDI
jgi:hypothetical protein